MGWDTRAREKVDKVAMDAYVTLQAGTGWIDCIERPLREEAAMPRSLLLFFEGIIALY
jgi:hypothetical protein